MTTSDPTPPRRTLTHTLRSRGAAPETLKPPNAVFTGAKHLQARRVIIFTAFVTAYFLSQFLRQANAVIATDIVSEFGLTAGQLGLMTSLFYLAFATVQLPLGSLLDHHGPRAVTPLIMLIAVPGCLLFASAHNFPALSAGRALVGLGMSGVLMGAYVAFGAWFPTERFSTLAGLLMGLGSLGGLGAAAPLAWLNDAVGWRAVFYVAAGLVLLSAGAVAIWARDPHRTPTQTEPHEAKPQADTTPPDTPMQPSHTRTHPHNLGTVLRSGDFWRIALMFFWMPGTMLAIQGLWAGPFLHDVLGLSSLRVGAHLMLIPIGAVLGNLVSGFLGDRLGPGRVVYVAAACFFVTQIGFMGLTLYTREPPSRFCTSCSDTCVGIRCYCLPMPGRYSLTNVIAACAYCRQYVWTQGLPRCSGPWARSLDRSPAIRRAITHPKPTWQRSEWLPVGSSSPSSGTHPWLGPQELSRQPRDPPRDQTDQWASASCAASPTLELPFCAEAPGIELTGKTNPSAAVEATSVASGSRTGGSAGSAPGSTASAGTGSVTDSEGDSTTGAGADSAAGSAAGSEVGAAAVAAATDDAEPTTATPVGNPAAMRASTGPAM